MSADFRNAAERLNQFASLDPGLRRELSTLCKAQSRDDKLALKLEEGRIYGLRQEYYDMRLKRGLTRSLRRDDPTEEHW
jgi:hypothetical protein